MAESTRSPCNTCTGDPAGDGGMEETWWSCRTTRPNSGASRNEILMQEQGAMFPKSSSITGKQKAEMEDSKPQCRNAQKVANPRARMTHLESSKS